MTKVFYKLQDALDGMVSKNESIFQNQTNGKRYYVVATNKEYWDTYLNQGDRFGYEVIRSDMPCHLYIDLDINKEEYPSIIVEKVYDVLKKYIYLMFTSVYGIKREDILENIHTSSCGKKGSMHVIYNIRNKIFKSSAHCGAFMQNISDFVMTCSESDKVMFLEHWVDMSVYSRNRLFRMLGCTKWGQKRYLTNGKTYSYEEWSSNKVQPLLSSSYTFMGILRGDGTEPTYSSTNIGITGWKPPCVDIVLKDIEEKVAKAIRTHAHPLQHRFSCNLDTRQCPFQKRMHSKNRIYVNISLSTYSYHFRCHSPKCKGLTSKTYKFSDSTKEYVYNYLNQNICLPAVKYTN